MNWKELWMTLFGTCEWLGLNVIIVMICLWLFSAYYEIVTPLVTQISWKNHLLIMLGYKIDEEREFYIRLCIKENYSESVICITSGIA